ncbi:MAG: hypothetical protein NC180_06670 [Muribaculaceae bacterium]|nr:hypothetical protein [Roseburia sp.]MCM1429836.1 hypothetical protein [Muribaculaceae bacterium]MCM1492887.1 hypothetical protein [Muribaculaceae bacterium]
MASLGELFGEYKNIPIALYGLGTETETALTELDAFEIVGLLDSFREDGILYGKNILSLPDCAKAGVQLIIVVARPGSCRAIAKKIGAFCEEHQIRLLDVRGKDLLVQKRVTYHFAGIAGSKKTELLSLAEKVEVISFDLFDTLIMRKVLLPTDVVTLLELRLRERGIDIDDFVRRRISAEKELSKEEAPFLEVIYQSVLDQVSPVSATAEELARLEWELDCELVVPRRELTELLSELHRQGKQIYIVTDSYYRQEQIAHMLRICGICDYDGLLVSCEYHTGKRQHLFREFRSLLGGRISLHVGDDSSADIESAQKEGLSAFPVPSGMDLLEDMGYLGFCDSMDTLASRLKLGMLVSKVFNSPFLCEDEEQRLHVDSAYDIGYLFMAPMITDFVLWFAEEVRKRKLANIWFCARDGFLIKKLYDILRPENRSVYLLTSRMAALRAGVQSREDISYIGGMKFSGTLGQQLKERFGIVRPDGETQGKALLDYTEVILEELEEKRKNNLKYVESLSVREGSIGFFDFVAKGTSQMYCSRLVPNHLEGLYFLQLEKSFMKDKGLDIQAFYDESERAQSAIYEEYYILETILTSPMPSVLEFDSEGNPCYADETRSEVDIACFMQVQSGIMDYFKEYIKLCPEEIRTPEKGIDEILLRLIHGFSIRDKAFLGLTVEDPFFNRMTDIRDLL